MPDCRHFFRLPPQPHVRVDQRVDPLALLCHGAIVRRQSGGPLVAEPVVMADSGGPPLR
jgi:hypothetical protein